MCACVCFLKNMHFRLGQWGVHIKGSLPSRVQKCKPLPLYKGKLYLCIPPPPCTFVSLAHNSDHLNMGNFLSSSISPSFSYSLQQTQKFLRIFCFVSIWQSLSLCFSILNLKDDLCRELFSDVDLWDSCRKNCLPDARIYLARQQWFIKRQSGDTHIKAAFMCKCKDKKKTTTRWMTKSFYMLREVQMPP